MWSPTPSSAHTNTQCRSAVSWIFTSSVRVTVCEQKGTRVTENRRKCVCTVCVLLYFYVRNLNLPVLQICYCTYKNTCLSSLSVTCFIFLALCIFVLHLVQHSFPQHDLKFYFIVFYYDYYYYISTLKMEDCSQNVKTIYMILTCSETVLWLTLEMGWRLG